MWSARRTQCTVNRLSPQYDTVVIVLTDEYSYRIYLSELTAI